MKNLCCDQQKLGGEDTIEDNGTQRSIPHPESVPRNQEQDVCLSTEMVPEKPAGTREVMLTTSNVLEDNPMWQMIARRCPDEW